MVLTQFKSNDINNIENFKKNYSSIIYEKNEYYIFDIPLYSFSLLRDKEYFKTFLNDFLKIKFLESGITFNTDQNLYGKVDKIFSRMIALLKDEYQYEMKYSSEKSTKNYITYIVSEKEKNKIAVVQNATISHILNNDSFYSRKIATDFTFYDINYAKNIYRINDNIINFLYDIFL